MYYIKKSIMLSKVFCDEGLIKVSQGNVIVQPVYLLMLITEKHGGKETDSEISRKSV